MNLEERLARIEDKLDRALEQHAELRGSKVVERVAKLEDDKHATAVKWAAASGALSAVLGSVGRKFGIIP